MKEWAKREVELACKRERENSKGDEWNYGVACYESALKAFNSLTEDGHSGFSIGITKNILNRLIDGKPLTPIEDTEDDWEESFGYDDGCKHYQCKRMSSLFKDVSKDGKVEFNDVDMVQMYDVNNPNVAWRNGFISRIIREMYPIKMPYSPGSVPYKVFCDDCLTDPKNGDYDTKAILYLIKPDGERVEINRYFKESENRMVEIDEEEYKNRLEMANKLKERQSKSEKKAEAY